MVAPAEAAGDAYANFMMDRRGSRPGATYRGLYDRLAAIRPLGPKNVLRVNQTSDSPAEVTPPGRLDGNRPSGLGVAVPGTG